MTLFFFQSFCTKKWPSFLFNVFERFQFDVVFKNAVRNGLEPLVKALEHFCSEFRFQFDVVFKKAVRNGQRRFHALTLFSITHKNFCCFNWTAVRRKKSPKAIFGVLYYIWPTSENNFVFQLVLFWLVSDFIQNDDSMTSTYTWGTF